MLHLLTSEFGPNRVLANRSERSNLANFTFNSSDDSVDVSGELTARDVAVDAAVAAPASHNCLHKVQNCVIELVECKP